jgi:hypothetical protein
VPFYPLGQPVRLTTTVKDISGNLTDPGDISLVLQLTDGTTTTYDYNPGAIVRDSPGAFHLDLSATDLTIAGHYQYKWVTTGTAAGASGGSLDVYDLFEPAVLSLQDAKAMLNVADTTTTYDAEILSWVNTIEAALEKITGGPLVNRTVTGERCEVTDNARTFVLRKRPLVSVTSVIDAFSGQTFITTDLDVDTNSGVVRRRLGLPFITAYSANPIVLVTYVAGWGIPTPPAFNAAARIILDHLWATQRGPSTRPSLSGEETTETYGLGFAVPNRAAELLAPYALETASG